MATGGSRGGRSHKGRRVQGLHGWQELQGGYRACRVQDQQGQQEMQEQQGAGTGRDPESAG